MQIHEHSKANFHMIKPKDGRLHPEAPITQPDGVALGRYIAS